MGKQRLEKEARGEKWRERERGEALFPLETHSNSYEEETRRICEEEGRTRFGWRKRKSRVVRHKRNSVGWYSTRSQQGPWCPLPLPRWTPLAHRIRCFFTGLWDFFHARPGRVVHQWGLDWLPFLPHSFSLLSSFSHSPWKTYATSPHIRLILPSSSNSETARKP